MSLSVKNICTEQWRLYDLDAVIDEMETEIANAVTENKVHTDKDYMNIVLRTAGRSLVGIREILCLSASGYPDGALALARNLYEHVMVLAFFENNQQDIKFENFVEDYHNDYDVRRIKAWKYECQNCSHDTAEIEKLSNEFKQLKENAHHEVKGDYWWSGYPRFNQLVDAAISSVSDDKGKRFLHTMHLTYMRACLSIHANCMGNTLRLGADPDFAGIDTAPTPNGHALPLWFATSSLIYIMGVTFSKLNLQYDKYDEKLNELAAFFYGKGF